jgi:hypothetical protein
MSSISEGLVLRKVTSFVATMGLILATIANLPQSASAANRGDQLHIHVACIAPKVAVPAPPPSGNSRSFGLFLPRPFSGTDLRR